MRTNARFLADKALSLRNWSDPPESNRRPTDYESRRTRNSNRADPIIPNEFGSLMLQSFGFGRVS